VDEAVGHLTGSGGGGHVQRSPCVARGHAQPEPACARHSRHLLVRPVVPQAELRVRCVRTQGCHPPLHLRVAVGGRAAGGSGLGAPPPPAPFPTSDMLLVYSAPTIRQTWLLSASGERLRAMLLLTHGVSAAAAAAAAAALQASETEESDTSWEPDWSLGSTDTAHLEAPIPKL
jgi:hypothetical protein